MTPKPLALSLGDPAGIGPEIVVKAWRALRQSGPAFMVVGDLEVLNAATAAGASALQRVTNAGEAVRVFSTALPVLDLPLQAQVVAGRADPAYASGVIAETEP